MNILWYVFIVNFWNIDTVDGSNGSSVQTGCVTGWCGYGFRHVSTTGAGVRVLVALAVPTEIEH